MIFFGLGQHKADLTEEERDDIIGDGFSGHVENRVRGKFFLCRDQNAQPSKGAAGEPLEILFLRTLVAEATSQQNSFVAPGSRIPKIPKFEAGPLGKLLYRLGKHLNRLGFTGKQS